MTSAQLVFDTRIFHRSDEPIPELQHTHFEPDVPITIAIKYEMYAIAKLIVDVLYAYTMTAETATTVTNNLQVIKLI